MIGQFQIMPLQNRYNQRSAIFESTPKRNGCNCLVNTTAWKLLNTKYGTLFSFLGHYSLKEVRIFDWPFTHTECRVCWNQNIYIAIYSYYELSVYLFSTGFLYSPEGLYVGYDDRISKAYRDCSLTIKWRFSI